MLEVGWLGHTLALAAAAAPLLHGHDVLVAFEEYVQDAHKLAAVHEIGQTGAFRLKKAREEAYTGVVLVHLVFFEADRYIFLEELHHMQEYLAIEAG